jgi:hypothetical protein
MVYNSSHKNDSNTLLCYQHPLNYGIFCNPCDLFAISIYKIPYTFTS